MTPILAEVSDFLDSKSSIFFTLCENMQPPAFSDTVKTAAVTFKSTLDNPETNVQFLINQKFWESLNSQEKCFLFAHESFHVLLKHGSRGRVFRKSRDDEIDQKKLNIAMDVCINEILLDQYFDFERTDMPVLGEIGCFLETVFPEGAPRGKSFEFYYDLIIDDDATDVAGGFDDHVFDHASDEELESSDKVSDKVSEMEVIPDEQISSGYSTSESNTFDNVVVERDKTAENLEKYLDFIVRTSIKGPIPKYKTQWYGTNRRMVGINNQNMTLPARSVASTNKPKILVYCDVSGSVRKYTQIFFALLNKVNRDKYNLVLKAFGTSVVDVTRSKKEYSYNGAGSGTEINAVLDDYKSLTDRYAGVVVLTDGEYFGISRLTDEKYSNWIFLFTRKSINKPKKAKSGVLKL